MSIDPNIPGAGANYVGRYYALPLRGRLTPYEGGTFSAAPSAVPEGDAKAAEKAEKKPGFSFGGFLDLINPLQHIPIISSLYRRITGDEIGTASRIAGDTLFFGVFGLASALVNTVIEKATGKDMGDHVMTAMLGEKDKAPAQQDNHDDGANNALAAIPQPDAQRGRVTVIPKSGTAPAPLDAATLDALARTIGSAEPLAHLAPPPDKDTGKEKPLTSGKTSADTAAAATYNDALIRMQQGLEHYQAQKSAQTPSPAN